MNDVITSGQSQRVPRKRRTHEEHTKMHECFLESWKRGKSQLEIRLALGLSASQFNGHLAEAVEAGELTGPPPQPDYVVIKFGTIQERDREAFRKRLNLNPQNSDLLKFEQRDNEIICSIIGTENNSSN